MRLIIVGWRLLGELAESFLVTTRFVPRRSLGGGWSRLWLCRLEFSGGEEIFPRRFFCHAGKKGIPLSEAGCRYHVCRGIYWEKGLDAEEVAEGSVIFDAVRMEYHPRLPESVVIRAASSGLDRRNGLLPPPFG